MRGAAFCYFAMLVSSERRHFTVSYLLQAAALLAVLIPFLWINNLQEWDFPGHYAAIWHLRDHLLPWPSGWNPYFYCGYPQGLFYPPLAHFLAALLAFLFGIQASVKLLVAASVLALPAVFYAFGRRFGLGTLESTACSSWMTALLFLSGKVFDTWSLGSDLHSTLNVGLFANALSLPVVFAFFAVCGCSIRRSHWKWAAILQGILLLLHPLSSLVAGLFFISAAATQWWNARGRAFDWKPLLWTPVVALLLGSIWVVPYLAYRGFMSLESVGAHWSPKVELLVFNGVILALAGLSKMPLRPLAVTYAALTNFIIIGTMWALPLQFTRFTIYLFLLTPIFVIAHVRSRFLILLLIALAVVTGTYGYLKGELRPAGVPLFDIPDFGRVQGRILSVVPTSHVPSVHVYHDLIPVRTGNESALGLFVEASFNGQFLANLVQTIEPDAYIWGTPTGAVSAQALGAEYPQYVRDRLNLFDIGYIYTDLKLENVIDSSLAKSKRYINSYPAPRLQDLQELDRLGTRYNVHGGQFDFYLYRVGTEALAQALPYVPKTVGSDWKLTNRLWYLKMRGVPIFTDSAVPEGVRGARSGEGVVVVSGSENMDRLILQINASQPVPVLVKVGYFPTWRLTVNGSPSRLYRASPSLMLFFGNGTAVLEYHRSRLEYAGLALSALGVAALFLLL